MAQVLDDRRHRIGLDGVTEVDAGWQQGSKAPDTSRECRPVVREERRATDPLREQVHGDASDLEHAGFGHRGRDRR